MSQTGNPSLLHHPAVDFRLEDLGGQPHALSDYRGRWLLLDFHRHLG